MLLMLNIHCAHVPLLDRRWRAGKGKLVLSFHKTKKARLGDGQLWPD